MGRIKGRGISAGVMGVIAGILLIVSLVSIGWYYVSGEGSYQGEREEGGQEFGLSEGERYYEVSGDREEDELDYDKGRDENSEIVDVFDFVYIFVLIGMILAFIFAVLAFLAGARLIPGWISLLVGIIAAITVIIGPVYMIFALPDAFDEENKSSEEDGPWDSFWGSDFESEMGITVESSWGPSWCWYVACGMGLMLFAAAGMCGGIERKKHKQRHSYPPAQGYGQPQRDPYSAPPPRSRDPYEDPYGAAPPQRSRAPYEDPYGAPPPRSRDPYEDLYGAPPPRSRDPYEDPYGAPPQRSRDPYGPPPRRDAYDDPYGAPPPRRDDYYDRDRHSSSPDNIPHTLTVFKCPECGAAIMENECPYCGFIR